jgi:inositol-pentakisphosphate 2-kinase
MHAHFRMTKGERKTATEYCPLDLYSCEYTRVRHALKTLWDDWVATGGDENNLRVFLDGKVVRPSEVRSECPHISWFTHDGTFE